jgi:hypothetical protein
MCVIENTQIYVNEMVVGDDYYQMLESFEDHLIHQNILNSKTKKAYLQLVEAVYENDGEIIMRAYDSNSQKLESYAFVAGLTMMSVLFNCPHSALDISNSEMVEKFNFRVRILDNLSSVSYADSELVFSYLNSFTEVEFNNIEERAPLINILIYYSFSVQRKS